LAIDSLIDWVNSVVPPLLVDFAEKVATFVMAAVEVVR